MSLLARYYPSIVIGGDVFDIRRDDNPDLWKQFGRGWEKLHTAGAPLAASLKQGPLAAFVDAGESVYTAYRSATGDLPQQPPTAKQVQALKPMNPTVRRAIQQQLAQQQAAAPKRTIWPWLLVGGGGLALTLLAALVARRSA